MVGGGIRYDTDGPGQIRRVFALAQHYDVDVDFHLDGGYDVQHLDYPLVCALTEQMGWQGRVAFGHGSKFSCLPVTEQAAIGQRLGAAGVALAVLPATDLFNAGRHMEHSVMRGVTDAHTLIEHGANCTLATNNVLNAFTPYGDCSLTRIANLYANVVQRYGPTGFGRLFRDDHGAGGAGDATERLWDRRGERRGPGGVGCGLARRHCRHVCGAAGGV